VAGPIAARMGVPATEYGAAVLIVVASLLALLPREVRSLRSGETPSSEPDSEAVPARVMAGS